MTYKVEGGEGGGGRGGGEVDKNFENRHGLNVTPSVWRHFIGSFSRVANVDEAEVDEAEKGK